MEEQRSRIPSMRATTPEDVAAASRYQQQMAQAEEARKRDILHRGFIALSMSRIPGATWDANVAEQARQIIAQEDAARLAAMSRSERLVLFALEQLLWGLAAVGVGEVFALGKAAGVGQSELGNALSDLGANALGRNLNRLEEFGSGAGFSGVLDVALHNNTYGWA